MKKSIKQGATAICLCMCLSGCGKVSGDKIVSPGQQTEAVSQAEENIEQSEKTDFFPESYSKQTEKVRFECQLEVPENFDVSDFHNPDITGELSNDYDKIYAKYVEGKVTTEEHHDGQDGKRMDAYIFSDGSVAWISDTEGFTYSVPALSRYEAVVRSSERGAPKDNFAFSTGDDCTKQVKDTLKSIGLPVDEYQLGWFSNSGNEYSTLEQQALKDGMIDSRNVSQDGWTEADDSYEIYGWQTYEGLQVLPWLMTSAMSRAVESYKRAPVSALYTQQGMLSLALTDQPFIFKPGEKMSEFLPFPEIADAVVQKYDSLLDDTVYTVSRAKLVLNTYHDDNRQLEAEPVWYFEVTGGSSMEIVLINAVTGSEIYLN